MDRIHHAAPHAADFFAALALRGGNLGAATTGLTRLLDLYDATTLDAALAQALEADSAHLPAVRQMLEQQRQALHQDAPVAVTLPDDPRVRDIVVQPHDLATYDRLAMENADDDDDNNNGR